MTGEELYARESTNWEGADPWDELLPSVQDGWNTLAAQITAWERALEAVDAAAE